MDLFDLWNCIWNGRWTVVIVTTVITALAIAYVFTANEWYRAEVLLIRADDGSGMGGLASQLGGIASLAGIGVGMGMNTEPVAVLKARRFAREFIEDKQLLTVLFADSWDADNNRWEEEDPEDWPDIRDAVKFFDENIRAVEEDALTGLVTLSIEWTDPKVAASWANEIVNRLNSRMRNQALIESQANVEFLRRELAATNVVSLQQSINNLTETELKKLMLARGNTEFAFKVIDPAEPPKRRSRPQRVLIVALACMLGGMLSVVLVVVRASMQHRRAEHIQAKPAPVGLPVPST